MRYMSNPVTPLHVQITTGTVGTATLTYRIRTR